MNFIAQAGMNQVKNQTQGLIQKEVNEVAGDQSSEGGKINESTSNSISNSNTSSHIPKKKKASSVISKALAIKMYAILLVHTAILTVVQYIILIIKQKNENFFSTETIGYAIYWTIFAVSLGCAVLLSLMVSKIKCFSSLYFIYILYVVLLALDLCFFNLGGHLISFDIFVSILIVFDAGSIVVLIFCSFIKEPPSQYWIMCSSAGGIILAIFLDAKLYEENRILVLIFGIYGFIIYEVMNYNAFKIDKGKKKNSHLYKEEDNKIPSAMVLPYELNASLVKMFIFLLEGVITIIKGCCSGKKKK